MKNKYMLVGQFPPPITGEAQANNIIANILKAVDVDVKIVNSSVIDTVSDVGRFSFIKVYRLLIVYFHFFRDLVFSNVLYMTPGQTPLGYFRFLPLVFFSLLFAKKIVLHWHGYGILSLAGRFRFLNFIYFNRKVKHIFLTNDLAFKMQKISGVTNFSVVKNFFKPYSSTEVANMVSDWEVQQANDKKINVLYLGGLMPQKGICTIVEAAKKTQDFDFTFCGSGDAQIVEYFTLLSSEGVVNYRGVVSGQQKLEVFQAADVFVLPTFYPTEGVPLTIIEAMSYGLCVVTTHHNGIPETVGDAAIYVEPNDPDGLLNVLNELNDNRAILLDYKRRSLDRAKFFSLAEFEKNMLDILTKD